MFYSKYMIWTLPQYPVISKNALYGHCQNGFAQGQWPWMDPLKAHYLCMVSTTAVISLKCLVQRTIRCSHQGLRSAHGTGTTLVCLVAGDLISDPEVDFVVASFIELTTATFLTPLNTHVVNHTWSMFPKRTMLTWSILRSRFHWTQPSFAVLFRSATVDNPACIHTSSVSARSHEPLLAWQNNEVQVRSMFAWVHSPVHPVSVPVSTHSLVIEYDMAIT